MVRAQIQLEEAQYEAIRRLAHRRRISMSEVVRRLVETGLRGGAEEAAGPTGAEGLLRLAGIAGSGVPDLGRRHDDYLRDDYER